MVARLPDLTDGSIVGTLRTARFIRAANIADPAKRLVALVPIRDGLDDELSDVRAVIRGTIAELRATTPPTPLVDIADLLGVSVQRVHQLSQPANPERK